MISVYIRCRGVFHLQLVIPAKAGIRKYFAVKAGCPPCAGMTGKTLHPSFINSNVFYPIEPNSQ